MPIPILEFQSAGNSAIDRGYISSNSGNAGTLYQTVTTANNIVTSAPFAIAQKILFTGTVTNQSGNIGIVPGTGIATISKAGDYDIDIDLSAQIASNTTAALTLVKNGVTVLAVAPFFSGNNANIDFPVCVNWSGPLAIGDKLDLRVGSNGTSVGVYAATLNICQLSGLSTTTVSVPNIVNFLSSGTYIPTPGMKYCVVEMVGGGGNGGYGFGTAGANTSYVGMGGNSGAYVKVQLTAAQIGASQSITIGGAGSPSSIGTLATANGGAAGSGTYANSDLTANSNTCSASGARATFTIAAGMDLGSQLGDMASTATCSSYNARCTAVTSDGADSKMGAGARGLKIAGGPQFLTTPGNFLAISAAANTGGGGSGDATYSPNGSAGVASAQAAGGSGRCLIAEFFS